MKRSKEMSPFLEWAKTELKYAGYSADLPEDNMNRWMYDHVMKLLTVFDEEGHSGSSAPYAVSLFKNLAMWKPIVPLTGNDDEWNEVGEGFFQNRRFSSVFKKNGQAYWLDGKVFWEWYEDPETGEKHKSYFTSIDSRVNIEFPFTIPDKPEYVFRETEEQ